jgi:rare lipoprotein A
MLSRFFISTFVFVFTICIASCSISNQQDGPPARIINTSYIKNPIPRNLPKSRYGNPEYYTINNKRYYVLKSAKNYDKTGIASWYGTKFHGRLTSTREEYNMYEMTAASPELPIPCYVNVTNLKNNQEIIVKVNDRGPFAKNRIIDLSYVAAKKLGILRKGTGLVRVTSINLGHHINHSLKHPHIYIQLGAFSQLYNAKKLKSKIEYLSTLKLDIKHNASNKLYKVMIGPIKSANESDRIIKSINTKFESLYPFIVVE